MDRVFLDANVLFSVAYGSPGIARLWNMQKEGVCQLTASRYVVEEARRNLDLSDQRARLEEKLLEVELVSEPPTDLKCPLDLPEKDRPVFQAALAAKVTHLITGDIQHFGPYLGQSMQGVLILTPAAYFATVNPV